MIDPLNIWHNIVVKDLLLDFYKKNFSAAGVNQQLAQEIIDLAWDSRNSPQKELEVRELITQKFEFIKTQVKKKVNEINQLDLFDYSEVSVYLDIGANKLDTINYLTQKYPNIDKFFAIDTISQNGTFINPDKATYIRVNNSAKSLPINTTPLI